MKIRTCDAGREVKVVDLNNIQLGDLKLEVGGDYYLVVDPYTLFDQLISFTRDGKDILSNDAIFAHPVCYKDGTVPAVAIRNINTYCYHDRTILHFSINTKSAVFGRDYKRIRDEATFAESKGFVSDMPKSDEDTPSYLLSDIEAVRYTTNPSIRRIKDVEGGCVISYFITNSQRDARNRGMEGVANNITDLIECDVAETGSDAMDGNPTGFVDAETVTKNSAMVTENDASNKTPTTQNNQQQKHKNRNKFTNGSANANPSTVKSTATSPEDLLKLSQN